MAIDLAKVEAEAPHLVNLAKTARAVCMEKGLRGHQAAVVMVLDTSGSTSGLYQGGKFQNVADRVFAVSLTFDDDGEVPLVMFGSHVTDHGNMTLGNSLTHIQDSYNRDRGGSTNLLDAIKHVRKMAAPSGGGFFKKKASGPASMPTYALIVTDGEPDYGTKEAIKKEIIEASKEAIFFQFIGIGGTHFPFLDELDNGLPGRTVDNVAVEVINDPTAKSDSEILSALLKEYPTWVNEATAKGILVKSATA